jgi:hypothetical protein
MAREYLRVFLTTGTRCRNVETATAYAIKDFKDIAWVSKQYCKLIELKNNEFYRWALDIPIWLAVKNDKVANAISYIQELNEWRELEMKDKQDSGLDMINKYLNNDE